MTSQETMSCFRNCSVYRQMNVITVVAQHWQVSALFVHLTPADSRYSGCCQIYLINDVLQLTWLFHRLASHHKMSTLDHLLLLNDH